MRVSVLALMTLAGAVLAFGQPSPYVTGSFTLGYNQGQWRSNGASTTTNGLVNGSLLSTVSPPTGNEYEIRTTYRLTQSNGSFAALVRASADAQWPGIGTFYAIEIAGIQVSSTGCSASLVLWKRASGQLSPVSAINIGCWDGMTLRTVVRGNWIYVLYEGAQPHGLIFWSDSSPIPAGAPGVGVHSAPAGNGILSAALYAADQTSPSQIQAPGVTATENKVEMQWPGVNDGSQGSGTHVYYITRQDTAGGPFNYKAMPRQPNWVDATVSPSTTYSYMIYPVDVHQNWGPARTITVTTPPVGSRDVRRIGLRPEGTYWGGAGEQIDVQSGNVNFTVPVVQARSRGGQTVAFSLNYNNQVWRRDAAGTWNFGRDIGYGFGWRLLAGSLTPIYSDLGAISYYLFTDSTGAEYRLNRATTDPADGVSKLWTTAERLFVTYEERTKRLRFNDGSFWAMDVESYETEEDAGTRYPWAFQDANGNRIEVVYHPGKYSPYINSSGRIAQIYDARSGYSVASPSPTYHFSYVNGHLQSVSGDGQSITFGYSGPLGVASPWGGTDGFGPTYVLSTVSRPTGGTYSLYYGGYGSATTGELQQVVLPYGGKIKWVMRDFTYTGGRTVREVNERWVQATRGQSGDGTRHWFWHDDTNDANRSYHAAVALVQDASGDVAYSDKVWWFHPDGRTSSLQERSAGGVVPRQTDYTWSTVDGKPYINASETKLIASGGQLVSRSEQTLDAYGNVTQSKQIKGASVRTTNYSYLHTSNSAYAERYVRNRLTSVSITDGATTFTPLSVTYDSATLIRGDLPTNLNFYDASAYSNPYRGNPTITTRGSATTTVSQIDYTGTPMQWTGPDGPGSARKGDGTISKYAAPTEVTVNGITMQASWDAMLRLSSTTGPSGETTTFGWDWDGRPLSHRNPDGSSVSISYDIANAQTTEQSGGRWTRLTLDGLGRTIKTERGYGGRPIPNTFPVQYTAKVAETQSETEYTPCACGPFGKVKRESVVHAAGTAPAKWTTYYYDALGRSTSVTGPDGQSVTSYTYNVESTGSEMLATTRVDLPVNTSSAARWKKGGTDAFGELRRVWEPKPGGGEYITDYTYNALGKLAQVSMTRDGVRSGVAQQVGQTRSWVYQANGELKSTTFPETGTTEFKYAGGRLDEKKDALGRKTRYVYEGSRLTRIERYPTATALEDESKRTTFAYSAVGRLESVTYGNSGVKDVFTYTWAGQLASKRIEYPWEDRAAQGWKPFEAKWSYDAEGRVDVITYPSGKRVRMRYDTREFNTQLTDPDQIVGSMEAELATAQYSWRGVMTQMTGPNSFSQGWGYNDLGQMTSYSTAGVSVTYNYGLKQAAGKLESMTQNGSTVSYGYDSLGRLTSAAAPSWSQAFTYDGFGTLYRKVATGAAAAVGVGDWTSLLDSAKNQVGAHDAVGNATGWNVAYDYDNRLVSHGTEQYAYDSGNKRVLQWNAGTNWYEVTLWAGGQRIAVKRQRWDTDTGWQQVSLKEDLYIGGRRTAPSDRLGSNLSGGRVLLPYGEELAGTPNPEDKFATYRRDETGLDYADQRYYKPGIGGFMTADPYQASAGVESPASWNRHTYVEGDPVNFGDPTGLDSEAAPIQVKMIHPTLTVTAPLLTIHEISILMESWAAYTTWLGRRTQPKPDKEQGNTRTGSGHGNQSSSRDRLYERCVDSQMENIEAARKYYQEQNLKSVWLGILSGAVTTATRTPGGIVERVAGGMIGGSVTGTYAALAAAYNNAMYDVDVFGPAVLRTQEECARMADAATRGE